MNILFTCGGTAGHVNPAVALARIFQEKHPGCRVLFVGADGAEIASKTYHSKSDLTEAVEPSTTDPQSGFFNYKSDGNGAFSSVSVQTATEYITLESLLKDVAYLLSAPR